MSVLVALSRCVFLFVGFGGGRGRGRGGGGGGGAGPRDLAVTAAERKRRRQDPSETPTTPTSKQHSPLRQQAHQPVPVAVAQRRVGRRAHPRGPPAPPLAAREVLRLVAARAGRGAVAVAAAVWAVAAAVAVAVALARGVVSRGRARRQEPGLPLRQRRGRPPRRPPAADGAASPSRSSSQQHRGGVARCARGVGLRLRWVWSRRVVGLTRVLAYERPVVDAGSS